MTAVVNATPLIALAMIGHLDLLKALFDEVVVPGAVYNEVTHNPVLPGAREVSCAHWIRRQEPVSRSNIEPLLLGLDLGELHVLLLAREIHADWVLIDERLARRVASAMGCRAKGTAGLVLAGFRAGLLTQAQVTESVGHLLSSGMRIGPRVVAWLDDELGRPFG